MPKPRPTIADAIGGGAYLDVDGQVMTIHQPHTQNAIRPSPLEAQVSIDTKKPKGRPELVLEAEDAK